MENHIKKKNNQDEMKFEMDIENLKVEKKEESQ